MYTTKSLLKALSHEIIGASIKVHKSLGPGLLESIYHECLKIELTDRGIAFETELRVPLLFNSRQLETILRCDIFIEQLIVLELKAVNELIPIHDAQLLTYMKLLKAPKGFLFNFNCYNLVRDGQKAFVNDWYAQLPD